MKKLVICATTIALLFYGCASTTHQQKGTVIGAAGGAAIGAAVSKGSVWGILIGAAVGGLAGNLIGKKMDQQAAELKQAVPTASVERVGEGINLTFDSELMFAINSAKISDSYRDDLKAATEVFVKYPETNIIIEGHTDDTGGDDLNMKLSEKRAEAVKDFMVANGVAASRLTTKWYGESQPKYPNDSDANRQKNRRVELAVVASEEMKKQAEKESKNQ